ncbi:MAG: DNA repair protein RecN [Bacteroidetes bacterium]|nr:DNA repair protein RecN [Bacteroidota bacterium]
MLKSITIQNYALIEKAYIEFDQGFSAITGETGAGKSILLGALGLILGNRADQKAIKNTDLKCIVEGEFAIDQIHLKPFFLANDLDYDDVTILRREISSSGKSRAFVNDSPVGLNVLKELSEQLVDIHSQHQTLNLGKFHFQLNALDAFINTPELLNEYQSLYGVYKKRLKKLEELKSRNEKLKKDEDYYRYQLSELDVLKLDKDIFDELTEREKLLSNSEEIASGIIHCKNIIDENEVSVNLMLTEILSVIGRLSDYHSSIKSMAGRLNSVHIEMKDISAEISGIIENIEYDPKELQDIKNKLDLYYNMLQKHHVQSVEDLMTLKNEIAGKLLSIETIEEDIKEAEELLKKDSILIHSLADQLHKQRKEFAMKMSEEIKNILKQLGMNHAGFIIEINKHDELNPTGIDKVEFLFNANKGGKPIQLSSVASGGELSRLMLAVKSLIHQKNILPTVIFDEIDAGVSGEIAGKVGNILKKMSEKHQVLAITHLPQIASKAQYHYNVYKTEDASHTNTRIELLDEDGRVEAIAKMLSDDKLTETSLKAAQELLN